MGCPHRRHAVPGFSLRNAARLRFLCAFP